MKDKNQETVEEDVYINSDQGPAEDHEKWVVIVTIQNLIHYKVSLYAWVLVADMIIITHYYMYYKQESTINVKFFCETSVMHTIIQLLSNHSGTPL